MTPSSKVPGQEPKCPRIDFKGEGFITHYDNAKKLKFGIKAKK